MFKKAKCKITTSGMRAYLEPSMTQSLIILIREHATGMAMSFHRIVKYLNEIEYLASGFVTCCIGLFLGNSFFKRGKETI